MDSRYNECPDCGGPKARKSERCRSCCDAFRKATPRLMCINGCGLPMHAHGLCKRCSRRIYYKQCPDCDTLIGPKSKRCVPCSNDYKRNNGLIDRGATVDAELRRERMSDPAYALKIRHNRAVLAGYINDVNGYNRVSGGGAEVGTVTRRDQRAVFKTEVAGSNPAHRTQPEGL